MLGNTPAPASLTAVAGDDQRAPVGAVLDQPLTVQALDASAQPVAGVRVEFAFVGTADGATLDPAADTTVPMDARPRRFGWARFPASRPSSPRWPTRSCRRSARGSPPPRRARTGMAAAKVEAIEPLEWSIAIGEGDVLADAMIGVLVALQAVAARRRCGVSVLDTANNLRIVWTRLGRP